MKYWTLFLVAVIIFPILYFEASGSNPGHYETSEFLIGNVQVEVIFLESNGTIDSNSENWTSTEENNVMSEINAGLDWLKTQNPDANVSFWVEAQYRIPTSYEPINRSHTDQSLWVSEAMTFLGYPGSYYRWQVFDYLNYVRNSSGADWAFTIFMVDSSNDEDGCFSDWVDPENHTKGKFFAYAYLGGPFCVMTYTNNGWGIDRMDQVCAHEVCHIFWATDEYDGEIEYSGYLNVSDVDDSGCLMDDGSLTLSAGTWGQLGWRDTDNDTIQDIADTFPNTTLTPISPNQTYNPFLTYEGVTVDVPHPNQNPHGTGKNVTINNVTDVWFRIDSGTWYPATPIDGAFDETEEAFNFTTPEIWGPHTIEVCGINSVGNVEEVYANQIVTIYLPDINVTDQEGEYVSVFDDDENIYVAGDGYIPNSEVTIYIIPDDLEVTPVNAEVVTNKTVSADGALSTTSVWSNPLDEGVYDVWVDVNQNGLFEDVDVYESQGTEVYAFTVIPEQLNMLLTLLLFSFMTVIILKIKKSM